FVHDVLTGFDLKKEPRTILDAYNDNQGITRQFNLNLLTRINRELDADFNTRKFDHFAVYDPVQGAARSYLISLEEQEVNIGAAGKRFYFKPYETIYTEISQKFDDHMIQELADRHELTITGNFRDSRNWYADVLYRKL
ncbi:MAG: L-histidine N(alpha)-methyltransferase, partial [Sphingobacteriales bacterium]